MGTSEQTVDEENFQEDNEDGEEQPLVRTRSRRLRGRTIEPAETVQRADSPPSSPQPHVQIGHQRNVGFPSVEVFSYHHASTELWSANYSSINSQCCFNFKWGGISSEERDEALMLEAAMFGGIPEGAPYPFSFPAHGRSTHYPLVARPPSPSLTAQRLLREQQVLSSIHLLESSTTTVYD